MKRAVKSVPDTHAAYQFHNGYPTPAAAAHARDEATLQRAVIAYRFWYPTVSMEGIFNGNREHGIEDNRSIAILSAGPQALAFTANSDTPYGSGTLDLSEGPMVVELPPGPFIGLVNDHHQGWVLDMGLPGPDAANGGKHLVLPPDHRGGAPAGYHSARSSTLKNLIAIRAMPSEGNLERALESLREVRIYPLATAPNPQVMEQRDMSKVATDATCLRWEDNFEFWRVLKSVIDAEPLTADFLPMYGLLAALGIEKDKPFEPDARTKALLEHAARVGRDQMLVSAFDSAREDRINWPDRRWEWIGLVPNSAQFETPSGIDLEARDRWFAQAIVTSPAMFRRTPGAGSLYWLCTRDKTNAYLDGGKRYTLAVPLPVPGKLFWSVTVYDAMTRSQIRTEQNKAALRSLFELASLGDAKSVDLYFGPNAPRDGESRWIKTTPGRGWFAYFRIYGPEAAAFDRSWTPGDFVQAR